MMKSFVDKFNNEKIAANWLKRESPEDEILFASAASVIEAKGIVLKWYQRIAGQPVIFILTKDQLVLKSPLISSFTIIYAVGIIAFSIFYILSRELNLLALALLGLLEMLQQLKYQRWIFDEDIRKIILDSRNDAKIELIIDTKEKVFHTFLAQALPQNIWKQITLRTKTAVYS